MAETETLCAVCGASWECEHRKVAEPGAGDVEVEDPFGPPIVVPSGLPSKRELLGYIKDAVKAAEPRGLDRPRLLKGLGLEAEMYKSGKESRAADALNKAVRELINTNQIMETSFGYLITYSVARRIQVLEFDAEWSRTQIEEMEKNLAREQRRLDRISKELRALRDA